MVVMYRMIVGVILVFLLALPNSVAAASDKCGVMLNTRCTRCHYKSRICRALEKKSVRAWRRTIKRMVGHGVKLSRKEQQSLASCLVNLPKNAALACREQPVTSTTPTGQ